MSRPGLVGVDFDRGVVVVRDMRCALAEGVHCGDVEDVAHALLGQEKVLAHGVVVWRRDSGAVRGVDFPVEHRPTTPGSRA